MRGNLDGARPVISNYFYALCKTVMSQVCDISGSSVVRKLVSAG